MKLQLLRLGIFVCLISLGLTTQGQSYFGYIQSHELAPMGTNNDVWCEGASIRSAGDPAWGDGLVTLSTGIEFFPANAGMGPDQQMHALLSRRDLDGQLQWTTCLRPDTEADRLNTYFGTVERISTGYVILAHSRVNYEGFALVKLDFSGNIQNTSTTSVPFSFKYTPVQVSNPTVSTIRGLWPESIFESNGDLYVLLKGCLDVPCTNRNDAFLIRIDGDGNQVGSTVRYEDPLPAYNLNSNPTLQTAQNDFPKMQKLPGGGIGIVSGSATLTGNWSDDHSIFMELGSGGQNLGANYLINGVAVRAFRPAPGGGYWFIGTTDFGPNHRAVLIRTDANLNITWQKFLLDAGGSATSGYNLIPVGTSGDVVVQGQSVLGTGYWFARIDASGSILWVYSYEGITALPTSLKFNSMDILADEGIVFTGATLSTGLYETVIDKVRASTGAFCEKTAVPIYTANSGVTISPFTRTDKFSSLVNKEPLGLSCNLLVEEQAPCECDLVADFSYSLTPCTPGEVQFTDLSTGNPASWYWDFGDGNTSILQNPSHIYLTGGPHTVTLTISDPNSPYCSDEISQTITVNAGPAVSLTYGGINNDNVIDCNENFVTVTANPSTGYIFNWYENVNNNSIWIGSGSQIIINHPGDFILIYTDPLTGESCTIKFIITQITDCCQPVVADSANYTVISTSLNNTLFTTSTTLSGQVYVEPNTILTVTNAAVLDITNVDMVFGMNAGIRVQNGARIRANNSVFRPCDETQTWRGISYVASLTAPTGHFNECLFKNAEVAVNCFVSGEVDFTNNEFNNNQVGIQLVLNQGYNGNITGNSFVVNGERPVFDPTFPSVHFSGIRMFGIENKALISENEFSFIPAPSLTGVPDTYFGIEATSSGFRATENTFTDLDRALDLDVPLYMCEFSHNEISYSRPVTGNPFVIRVANNSSAGILTVVYENEIRHPDGIDGTAIYLETTNSVLVDGNEISGFRKGIWVDDCWDVTLLRNEIEDARQWGILAEQCTNGLQVLENEIRMWDRNVTGTFGIGYYLDYNLIPLGSLYDVAFERNCISNSWVAMDLRAIYALAPAPNQTVPLIRDNYLFNYNRAGMYFDNFAGNIGTPGAAGREDGGRNSFISNWQGFTTVPPGFADVESTNGLIELAGNFAPRPFGSQFGNYTLAGNVNLNIGREWPSLSVCGNQVPDHLKTDGLTDDIAAFLAGRLPVSYEGGSFRLEANFDTFLSGLSPEVGSRKALCLQGLLISGGQLSAAAQVREYIRKEDEMPHDTRVMADILYEMGAGNPQAALDHIQNSQFDMIETEQYAALLEMMALRQLGLVDLLSLEQNEYDYLRMVEAERGANFQLCRDVLQVFDAPFLNLMPDTPVMETPESQASDVISTGTPGVTIYPNPGNGKATLRFSAAAEPEGTLEVYDVRGRKLSTHMLNLMAGEIEVDLATLASGVYTLVIPLKEDTPLHIKYIKE